MISRIYLPLAVSLSLMLHAGDGFGQGVLVAGPVTFSGPATNAAGPVIMEPKADMQSIPYGSRRCTLATATSLPANCSIPMKPAICRGNAGPSLGRWSFP